MAARSSPATLSTAGMLLSAAHSGIRSILSGKKQGRDSFLVTNHSSVSRISTNHSSPGALVLHGHGPAGVGGAGLGRGLAGLVAREVAQLQGPGSLVTRTPDQHRHLPANQR